MVEYVKRENGDNGENESDMNNTVVKKMRKKPLKEDKEAYNAYKRAKNNKYYYDSKGRMTRLIRYYKINYNVPDELIEANKHDLEELMIALKTYALKYILKKYEK